MIIIKLKWWLGNQMFQYAYIKALSCRTGDNFKLDLSFLQRMWKWYIKKDFKNMDLINYELYMFDNEENFSLRQDLPFSEKFHNKYIDFLVRKIYSYLPFTKIYQEKWLQFQESFLKIRQWYIDGYFQSEKYFQDFKNEIRKDFIFTPPLSSKNQEITEHIKSLNSISVHVRRWDYMSEKNKSLYGTCDLDYYKRAIRIIQEKINSPVFFFFSDDIEWVKENLQVENNSYYIDWNTGEQSYEDMRLMSLCKHNIIANSSFSWWGAWLNNNKEKLVIAPEKWFNSDTINYKDIVPETWIKI